MISKEEQKKLNDELMEASKYGWLGDVKALIKKGAEVNVRDSGGWTPLHLASFYVHLEVAKYLVEEAKVEVDAKDNWDQTPLHLASREGRLEVIKYLCEKGADVDAKDQWEHTPLHFAWERMELVKYLFLERNALMPIEGMFKYPELMGKKQGKETESQSILDYFLQNKSKYKPEEIQEFKKEFLEFEMNEEDSRNLKSIVKFL